MIVVGGDLDIDTMLVDRLNPAHAIATFTPDDIFDSSMSCLLPAKILKFAGERQGRAGADFHL